MPIYAYRCATCGHAEDVLQKMSDPLLTVCPACGAAAYTKQVTAAGFQLKGSGWYVTDFRGGNAGAKKKDEADSDEPAKPADAAASADGKPAAGGADKSAEKASDKPAGKPGDAAPAPAAAPLATKTADKSAAAPAPASSSSPPPSSAS